MNPKARQTCASPQQLGIIYIRGVSLEYRMDNTGDGKPSLG